MMIVNTRISKDNVATQLVVSSHKFRWESVHDRIVNRVSNCPRYDQKSSVVFWLIMNT